MYQFAQAMCPRYVFLQVSLPEGSDTLAQSMFHYMNNNTTSMIQVTMHADGRDACKVTFAIDLESLLGQVNYL